MTLEAGKRLGPYEVLAPLGAGGMGEVYRARDTRLSREVAIKLLPAGLARRESREPDSVRRPLWAQVILDFGWVFWRRPDLDPF